MVTVIIQQNSNKNYWCELFVFILRLYNLAQSQILSQITIIMIFATFIFCYDLVLKTLTEEMLF